MKTASDSFSQNSSLQHPTPPHATKTCVLVDLLGYVNPVSEGIHPNNKLAFPQQEKLMVIIKNYILNIVDKGIKKAETSMYSVITCLQ